MTNTQPARYTGAWRWGLLFGVIAAVLQDSTTLLEYLSPIGNELVGNLVSIVEGVLLLLLFGYAGYLAARRSGSQYTGNSAGLYAGLVSVLLSAPIWLLVLYSVNETVRRFIVLWTISAGCTIGIFMLLGLVAGLIGGKLAQRSLSRAR